MVLAGTAESANEGNLSQILLAYWLPGRCIRISIWFPKSPRSTFRGSRDIKTRAGSCFWQTKVLGDCFDWHLKESRTWKVWRELQSHGRSTCCTFAWCLGLREKRLSMTLWERPLCQRIQKALDSSAWTAMTAIHTDHPDNTDIPLPDPMHRHFSLKLSPVAWPNPACAWFRLIYKYI